MSQRRGGGLDDGAYYGRYSNDVDEAVDKRKVVSEDELLAQTDLSGQILKPRAEPMSSSFPGHSNASMQLGQRKWPWSSLIWMPINGSLPVALDEYLQATPETRPVGSIALPSGVTPLVSPDGSLGLRAALAGLTQILGPSSSSPSLRLPGEDPSIVIPTTADRPAGGKLGWPESQRGRPEAPKPTRSVAVIELNYWIFIQ